MTAGTAPSLSQNVAAFDTGAHVTALGWLKGTLALGLGDGAVDPQKFMPWISNLTQVEGPNILRCKGIVAFPDEPKRFVFQGVHMILDGDVQGDWKPGQKRSSKVVFIGRDLNEKAIREEFLACAV